MTTQYVTRHSGSISYTYAILPTLEAAKAHAQNLGFMHDERRGFHHVFIIQFAEGFGLYWTSEKRHGKRNAEDWLKGGCVAYGNDDTRHLEWSWEDMKPTTEADTWREIDGILAEITQLTPDGYDKEGEK